MSYLLCQNNWMCYNYSLSYQRKNHTSSSDSNLQWISNCHGMGRLGGSSKAAPKQDIAFMIHKSCFCVLGMYFTYRKSTMCSDCSSMQGSGVHLSHLLNVLLYIYHVIVLWGSDSSRVSSPSEYGQGIEQMYQMNALVVGYTEPLNLAEICNLYSCAKSNRISKD